MKKHLFEPRQWFLQFGEDISLPDLKRLKRALLNEEIVRPFNCGRNPYNHKLILRHEDSKIRLILVDEGREEELYELIENEIIKRTKVSRKSKFRHRVNNQQY